MTNHKLTWVLQSNSIGEEDRTSLAECILKCGHNVEFLRVIPFSHEPADPLPKIDGPCIVYGSSGLVKLGHLAKWLPCGWDGEAFELDVINRALGEMALNSNAAKTVYSQTFEVASANGWDTIFVRPISETKEFAGRVFKIDQLRDWVEKLNISGYFKNNDNPAIVAPALKLGREWRVFVVDGRQVTGCEYANCGIPESRAHLPCEVTEFVEQTLRMFKPAPCFVVDVAEVLANGTSILKIIEYNSINSSGFYACDKATLIDELSRFALSNYGG